MRYEQLYLAGLGSYLPPAVPVDDAVDQGDYDLEEQLASGQVSVCVAGPDDSQPGMAAEAGRLALERSGHKPEQSALLLHAVTSHNGMEGWNAAAYLQHEVVQGHGTAIEIRQLSNGGMAALELGAAYLGADAGRDAVVITASDRFDPPTWNRWASSWGLIFADGASSGVLSQRGGFAQISSIVNHCDAGLEVLHRGSLPFTATVDPALHPIDFRARTLDSSLIIDMAESGERLCQGMRTAVFGCAAEAGIEVTDFDHYVVPNFGRDLLHRECLDPTGIPLERTTWSWASQVGHLGAADQLAGLTYLSESGRLEAGQRVLMVGVGGGFNWTCAALSILDRPSWSA